jgi:hypothetical protein
MDIKGTVAPLRSEYEASHLFTPMNLPQTISKHNGNQSLTYHHTVFPQFLKMNPGKEFKTPAKQQHTGRSYRTTNVAVELYVELNQSGYFPEFSTVS